MLPHNVAFVALGTGLLWFGWFGFNGGSALAANGVAAQAFVNTDIAGLDRDVHVAVHLLEARREAEPGRRVHRRRRRAGLHHAVRRASCPTWAAFIVGLLAGSVCYGAVHVPRPAEVGRRPRRVGARTASAA